jgi:hypothetical protein
VFLGIGESVLGDLREEHGAARPNFRHFDAHARIGFAALIECHGVRSASDLLAMPGALDVIIDPPDATAGRVFEHPFNRFRLPFRPVRRCPKLLGSWK